MPTKINARTYAPKASGSVVYACGPKAPGNEGFTDPGAASRRQPAQENAEARRRGGDDMLTSVGGESPEKTEFENGRRM